MRHTTRGLGQPTSDHMHYRWSACGCYRAGGARTETCRRGMVSRIWNW
jgi:hypothetical protein